MGMFSGIMKAIAPLALTVLTGGAAAPLMAMAMKAITTAVAQQAIQLIGQQLGLPPSVINMAQQAFSAASGQPGGGMSSIGETISSLTEQFNLSPSEAGSLMRTADEAQRSLVKGILESEEFAQAKNGGSAKGSIFMQIATALGKLADKKMGEMAKLATDIGGIKDGKNGNKVTEMTGQMQAKGQEFGLISNAMSNSIKSIGEGVQQLARKG